MRALSLIDTRSMLCGELAKKTAEASPRFSGFHVAARDNRSRLRSVGEPRRLSRRTIPSVQR